MFFPDMAKYFVANLLKRHEFGWLAGDACGGYSFSRMMLMSAVMSATSVLPSPLMSVVAVS